MGKRDFVGISRIRKLLVSTPGFGYFRLMKQRNHPTSATPVGKAIKPSHLRDALGNAALEGIELRPQAVEDLEAVVAGTLTADQYRQRVKAQYGVQR